MQLHARTRTLAACRAFLRSLLYDATVQTRAASVLSNGGGGGGNGNVERPTAAERRATLLRSVRLDWASAEDGTHILTVGVANCVFFFAQMSQSTAQTNVTLLAEDSTTRKPTLRRDSSIAAASFERGPRSLVRWVCLRYLQLESIDGLAPLPSVMSWVRDGLLVVGMPSEMRVYGQWNLCTVSENETADNNSAASAATTAAHANAATATAASSHQKSALKVLGVRPVASASNLSVSPSQCMLDQVLKLAATTKPPTLHTSADARADRDGDASESLAAPPPPVEADALRQLTNDEGIFEAARLAAPILPQYHPQQLIKMLNSGKTRRVKAILLHVLRSLKVSG